MKASQIIDIVLLVVVIANFILFATLKIFALVFWIVLAIAAVWTFWLKKKINESPQK